MFLFAPAGRKAAAARGMRHAVYLLILFFSHLLGVRLLLRGVCRMPALTEIVKNQYI